MDIYKENVAKACRNLAESRKAILSDLVNVALAGEFADIDQHFEVGDVVNFQLQGFSTVSDTNVQMLYQIIAEIDQCYRSLVNINGLDIKE